jgi:pyruvoyl-dependent arginine decarboxylase (PvlArgDC)
VNVQVRLGAGLARTAGVGGLGIELPPGATVETLLARLGAAEPAIAAGLGSALPVVRWFCRAS